MNTEGPADGLPAFDAEPSADGATVQSSWVGLQRIAVRPRAPAQFEGRAGYQADFLGTEARVGLPAFSGQIDPAEVARLADGSHELRYQHFSVAQCASRRMPYWTACNVDGSASLRLPRHDTWSFDGRIPTEAQMLREAYGPQAQRKFSRGHMTRRQDPNWGAAEDARRANADTFTATNACPQWQPFNEGLWGDLEDYVLDHVREGRKRISVFTGPVLAPNDPVRFGVRIPRDFWKVVAFLSEGSGRLAAIAYVMSQGRYLDTGIARDLEDFEMAQVPLMAVERRTGLRFDDLKERDVYAGVDPRFVRPIRRLADTRLPD